MKFATMLTMTESNETILRDVRRWMESVLDQRPELTPAKWAEKAGVAVTTVTRRIYPKPDNPQTEPKSATLAKLAKAAGVDVPVFTKSSRDHENEIHHFAGYETEKKSVAMSRQGDAQYPHNANMVPVVGKIAAGAFNSVKNFEFADDDTVYVPFFDKRYDPKKVAALIIDGDSVNRKYPHGSTVFFAKPEHVGLRDKRFVVAMIPDETGGAAMTVKRFVLNGEVRELHPFSTNSELKPIILPPRDDVSQDGAQIVGVVIGSYVPGDDGEGPLVDA